MSKIFGFADDDFAPLPDDVQGQVTSTFTLSGGQSMTDDRGNTYKTTGSDETTGAADDD